MSFPDTLRENEISVASNGRLDSEQRSKKKKQVSYGGVYGLEKENEHWVIQ